MKVTAMYLINLYPVAAGGGLQNAYSFLNELKSSSYKNECVCILRDNSSLVDFCIENEINFEKVPDSKMSRLLFEFYFFNRIAEKYKSKVVFTLFGNPPLNSPGITKISGFARSNIIEKSVNFWGYLNILKRVKMLLLDKVILYMMRRSDVVILETERLRRLSLKHRTFGKAKIEVVNMSPSSTLLDSLKNTEKRKIGNKIKILYLSGAHPNKNIHQVVNLIEYIKVSYDIDISLVTTLDENTEYFRIVSSSFTQKGIFELLDNRGTISPQNISELIQECDALINIATLESFSNNWVEAWASRRLLICRDSGYARDSCGDAAFYLNLDDMENSADSLVSVLFNEDFYDGFCLVGSTNLKNLPTPKQKFECNFEIINRYES